MAMVITQIEPQYVTTSGMSLYGALVDSGAVTIGSVIEGGYIRYSDSRPNYFIVYPDLTLSSTHDQFEIVFEYSADGESWQTVAASTSAYSGEEPTEPPPVDPTPTRWENTGLKPWDITNSVRKLTYRA